MLPPWDVFFDGLHFLAKTNPKKINEKYSLGAALVPSNARRLSPAVFPSEVHKLLAFVGQETMRLQLPVVAPTRAVVNSVHDVFNTALAAATPAGDAGLIIPLSTVEHENEQLTWGRTSATVPPVPVPLCRYDADCDAHLVQNSQGRLPVYLTVAEQDIFDQTGEVPPMALFCLLCIRRDAQAFYLTQKLHPVHAAADLCRSVVVVPPFQNLVETPGGYTKTSMGVQPSPDLPAPVSIVGVMSGLKAVFNPYKNKWHVDQGKIVYGASLN